jgi:hypothetical protein
VRLEEEGKEEEEEEKEESLFKAKQEDIATRPAQERNCVGRTTYGPTVSRRGRNSHVKTLTCANSPTNTH